MALERYRCVHCRREVLLFPDEPLGGSCTWQKIPTRASTVIATAQYMIEYQLDSIHSTSELDKQLTEEAAKIRMDKALQEARRNA